MSVFQSLACQAGGFPKRSLPCSLWQKMVSLILFSNPFIWLFPLIYTSRNIRYVHWILRCSIGHAFAELDGNLNQFVVATIDGRELSVFQYWRGKPKPSRYFLGRAASDIDHSMTLSSNIDGLDGGKRKITQIRHLPPNVGSSTIAKCR